MHLNQRITEVTGRPGKVWGNVLVPAKGTITVRIAGDVLQSSVKSGMEKSDSWVRIQNVDSVEITESPEYTLLALGVFLILTGLGLLPNSGFMGFVLLVAGGACIAYGFINKRRLLAIYSLRHTIPVFMNRPPDSYQQFATSVLEVARQLNARPQTATANSARPAPARSPASARSVNPQVQ